LKKLDRYLLRELLIPFLIGTVAVVLMFQANTLIAVSKEMQVQQLPALAIFQYILYRTPGYASMTLPVGMALASSLALSRLTRESELTAMRTAGVSILRVVRPVVIVGCLVALGNFWIVERVMPQSEVRARTMMNQLAMLGAAPTFRSNVVINIKSYTASFGTVSRGAPDEVLLTQILLIERPNPDEVWMYSAKDGTYRAGVWTLREPYLRILKGEDLVVAKGVQNLVINEPISIGNLLAQPQPTEQSLESLSKAIQQNRQMKRPTTELEIAYHSRFSVPAACILFALTGPVFAIRLSRSGAFVGVLLSIVLVLLYYNAFIISTEVIGRLGWVPPVLSAWLPNLIFLVLGFLALRRAE